MRFLIVLLCAIMLSGCEGILEPDDIEPTETTKADIVSVYGISKFVCEKPGIGSDFVIVLKTDNSCVIDEGIDSPYEGKGYYSIQDGICTVTDVIAKDVRVYKFKVNDDLTELRYIKASSDDFPGFKDLDDDTLFSTDITHSVDEYATYAEPDKDAILVMLKGLTYRPDKCDGLSEYTFTAEDGTVYQVNITERWVYIDGAGKAVLTTEQADLLNSLIRG